MYLRRVISYDMPQCMSIYKNKPEKSQTDVDEQISSATSYHKDTDRWHCRQISFRVHLESLGEHTEDGDEDKEECGNHF